MTGCQRILARLERGPATAAELYAETFTVVHSRISDLRKRGYVITCEHTGGHDASSYLYRLLGGAEGNHAGDEQPASGSRTALRSSEQVAPSRRRDAPSPAACSPIQLELETESRFGSGLSPYASSESRAA